MERPSSGLGTDSFAAGNIFEERLLIIQIKAEPQKIGSAQSREYETFSVK